MTWNYAIRMPKGCCGKYKRFQRVGLCMCMDAKTDDNFSLICDRFLRQKGNNFHIQGNDSKKGGVCGPALQRYSMDAELLLEPPPAVADQSCQPTPQQEHRGGFGDGGHIDIIKSGSTLSKCYKGCLLYTSDAADDLL